MGDKIAAIQSNPLPEVRVAMCPQPRLLGISVIELGGSRTRVVVDGDHYTVVFWQQQRLERTQNSSFKYGF